MEVFMPLYEYKCVSCKREFEDLSVAEEKDNPRPCPSCGKQEIVRKISTFGINTTITAGSTVYSPKEIDKVVGAASAKSWEGWENYYAERRKKRREGKDLKEVVVGKDSEGTVKPFEHLGTPKEQEFRKEYSKEYKTQISDKGKDGDFNAPPVIMKVDKTV
jgi:putative FmdB family regulatory protein